MLMELKSYLETNGPASLEDMANRFRIAPDALRGMLDHWVRKGAIVRKNLAPACGGCSVGHCGGCTSADAFEIYTPLQAGLV
ncbi:FeoC-like transcriptional regulator [Tropicimonas sp.]|uniref:FeoC-like transcriptional regulator n=1 Tax=Tropicimonas sp. TaxID=2067044 RepID=UPI003A8614CD